MADLAEQERETLRALVESANQAGHYTAEYAIFRDEVQPFVVLRLLDALAAAEARAERTEAA